MSYKTILLPPPQTCPSKNGSKNYLTLLVKELVKSIADRNDQ